MFVNRSVVTGTVLAAVLIVALGTARATGDAAPGERYVVRPGDTLWALAATRYDDVRRGVWAIRRVNGLERGGALVPGSVLRLP
jgi:nucleoid-associated protein YgaU